MPLSAGTRLGPYEILAPLGAGGMGEVYKARDERLNRTVAIKVLPQSAAGDQERRKRLLREARTASALNHSNIVTIYDIVSEDGRDSIVMEYVEGSTLETLLERKGVPIAEVLQYGIQIADALAAAHAAGIVHRDLKPGNIMVTKGAVPRGGVKVLDFGLAKFAATAISPSQPTETLTAENTIAGTLAYMAPEQLAGKDCDARTDLFALGLVLYEMAAGKRAFAGDSSAALIAAIMSSQPPALENAPPQLAHLINGCLAKEPSGRRQSAHDLAVELRWIEQAGAASPSSNPSSKAPGRRERAAWVVAVIVLISLLAFSRFYFGRTHIDSATVEFSVPVPEDATAFAGSQSFLISPGGTDLAIQAFGRDGQQHLWLRPIGSSATRLLPGTDGSTRFFWSPDGRHLGFFSKGKLRKIDIQGGPAADLCDFGGGIPIGVWSPDGHILFTSQSTDVWYRVSEQGGSVERMEGFPKGSLWGPHFLPDGRFLIAIKSEGSGAQIHLGATGRSGMKPLMQGNDAFYTRPPGSPQGYILFRRDDLLLAQRFDLERELVIGEPFGVTGKHIRGLTASENGVLAYGAGAESGKTLVWMDRQGQPIATLPEGGDYREMSLSPDESTLAISRVDTNSSLWLMELPRGATTKLTSDRTDHWFPVWSPDGQRIAYSLWGAGAKNNLYVRPASGGGSDRPLLQSATLTSMRSWSPDGQFLAYEVADPKTRSDVWILPIQSNRPPFPFVQTEYNELQAEFSPDGHWIAYTSDESGRQEIYVRKFEGGPAVAGARRISLEGGSLPKWRRDGKELFYLTPGGKLMSVEIAGTSTLTPGLPRPLFQSRVRVTDVLVGYAVAANGQRFLVNIPTDESESTSFTVVVNWNPDEKR